LSCNGRPLNVVDGVYTPRDCKDPGQAPSFSTYYE